MQRVFKKNFFFRDFKLFPAQLLSSWANLGVFFCTIFLSVQVIAPAQSWRQKFPSLVSFGTRTCNSPFAHGSGVESKWTGDRIRWKKPQPNHEQKKCNNSPSHPTFPIIYLILNLLLSQELLFFLHCQTA